MSKNGLTLIELMAVIVILSIVSLITIPIVLNLVEDFKEQAFRRSVENVFRTYLNEDARKNFKKEEVLAVNLKLDVNNFISGRVYQTNDGTVIVDKISDGIFCAKGTTGNLTIVKGSCDQLD